MHPDRAGRRGRQIAATAAAGARGEAADWYVRAAGAAQRCYANADARGPAGPGLAVVGAEPDLERELGCSPRCPPAVRRRGLRVAPRCRGARPRARARTGRLPARPAARPGARLLAATTSPPRQALRRTAGARGADEDVLAVEGDYVLGIAASWRGERRRPASRFRRRWLATGPSTGRPTSCATAWTRHLLPDPAGQHAVPPRRRRRGPAHVRRRTGLRSRDRPPPPAPAALVFGALLALDLGDVPRCAGVGPLVGRRAAFKPADRHRRGVPRLPRRAGRRSAVRACSHRAPLAPPGDRPRARSCRAMLARIRLAAGLAAG